MVSVDLQEHRVLLEHQEQVEQQELLVPLVLQELVEHLVLQDLVVVVG